MTTNLKRKYEQTLTAAVDSPILNIKVGKKTFHAPWGVLAHHSSYFSGLMNSHFEEAETRTVTLEDTDETTFQAFLRWIYFGKLYDEKTTKIDPLAKDLESRTVVNLTQVQLCKLWVFGDMRGAPKFQNEALRMLKRHVEESWVLAAKAVCVCYDNTMVTSKLRAFWIEFSALHYGWEKASPFMQDENDKDQQANVFPNAFVLDTCGRLRELLRQGKKSMGGQNSWKTFDIGQYMVPEDPAPKEEAAPAATEPVVRT